MRTNVLAFESAVNNLEQDCQLFFYEQSSSIKRIGNPLLNFVINNIRIQTKKCLYDNLRYTINAFEWHHPNAIQLLPNPHYYLQQ